MKKIYYLLVLLPLVFYGQTSTENYIKTISYKKPTSSGSVNATNPADAKVSINYYDGLGRPIQNVAYKQAGNGNDLVTHIEYDALGRQAKEFLPIEYGQTLDYHSINSTTIGIYYGTPSVPSIEATGNPYSEKLFEASPLQRILEQASPGNDWSITNSIKHTVRLDYQTNEALEVKLFSATANGNNITLNQTGTTSYTVNQLYKTITKDENWKTSDGNNNTTEEFKNKEGKLILKRTYNGSIPYDTYYVYDQFGNLTYVIPPKADGVIDTAVLNALCYQYKYDNRNRLVEKKLPEKQWEFIVYDKLDRVVATGPVFSPFNNLTAPNNIGWMISKYDSFNRTVLTGWLESSTVTSSERVALQALYDTATLPVNESKSSSNIINGTGSFLTRYTNTAIPSQYATSYHVMSVNYFDDYNTNITFNPAIAYTSSVTPQAVYYNNTAGTQPKGLPTVSWIRVPEATTTTPIKAQMSYMLYDNKGRVVRTFSNNYLGGFTQVDSQLEAMTGRVNYTLKTHKRVAGSTVLTIREDFVYSAHDRLLTHTHKINSAPAELLSDNTYDELGLLISKKVGNSSSSPLQKIDYKYNIRGWLTEINDIGNLTEGTNPTDLFAFKINYNIVDNSIGNTIKPLYNGNICETAWKTNKDNLTRRYGYQYDNLNRLTNAIYQKPNGTTIVTNSYNESLTYDKNGNIMSLFRNGDLDSETISIAIDNLTYYYDANNSSNRLMKVFDSTNHPAGFADDSNGIADPVNDYTYDANGNLLTDDNKGITSISYNHLNLPVKIIFNNDTNTRIEYLYNTQGEKLKKLVSMYCDTCVGGMSTTITDYFDGFQYTGNILRLFPHAEGYVQNTFSGGNNIYSYVFNYTDHLGNIRTSYAWDTATSSLKILEENHYYPFGLKHSKYNVNTFTFVATDENGGGYNSGNGVSIKGTTRSLYQYKYNGKEFQDELGLNLYDYGARNYDPAIGRWYSIDNLSEEFYDWSPYNYVLSNPVKFIDPDGNGPTDIRILGANNSSVTIKTDLIDVSVNASSLGVDFGGNYSVGGKEVLGAALDIVGIFDPTGVADGINASISASDGNWGDALISAVGIIPYAGDLAKLGKVEKDVKIISNAIDAVKDADKATDLAKAEARAAKLSKTERAGKDFTKAGKESVKDVNKAKNNGRTVCETCGTSTSAAKQSKKGVTPPKNETHVDHKTPKSKGGSGTPDNGQVLCRDCNTKKSNN